MSDTFSLDQLRAIMRRCTGVEEGIDLDGDIIDSELDHLGYDSLAVLEIASAIQREHGLEIPDEAIDGMKTPGNIVDYVNASLASV